ncbi:MAG TPA: hypothetical protein PLW81_15460 [Thiobacillaceae bacterium]|nr:hypothetical protein [Thiobacillaceae bacterium]
MDLAGALANRQPMGAEFVEKLAAAKTAHAGVLQARTDAGACLGGRPCTLDPQNWIRTVTRFIDQAVLLQESAFLPADTTQRVAQLNLALKRWVWMASEYAGRERGILAWHVAMRRPLPLELREELAALRGVVEHALHQLREMRQMRRTDARIVAAIDGLERGFLNDYEISRNEV